MKLVTILVAGCLAWCLSLAPEPAFAASEGDVSVWVTSPDRTQLLVQQADIAFEDSGRAAGSPGVQVDPGQRFQEIEGFGGALTDSSAWLISTVLSSEMHRRVMRDLFDPQGGIGLSYVRVAIGASDFAREHYTYDDMANGQTDPSLARFSIDHDRAYIVPVLKEALALNPRLRVLASPWSPPAWMKLPPTLFGGTLNPAWYTAYADYLVRFIRAYEREGIPIAAITVQNEPHYATPDYPGMYMDASVQTTLVRDYLGPAFVRAGLSTRILVWDHDWDTPEYPLSVLGDQGAREYIAGSAFHCYNGESTGQTEVHDAYPDKAIYVTECSGYDPIEFDADLARVVRDVIIGGTRNWARAILLWNLVLDPSYGPHTGGCTTCTPLVTVAGPTQVTYGAEYYALGHVSRFVKPGAHRIEATATSAELGVAAFINADNSVVLLAHNADLAEQRFVVQCGTRRFATRLAPSALGSFTWSAAACLNAPGTE
jgi:glucosylceramidase